MELTLLHKPKLYFHRCFKANFWCIVDCKWFRAFHYFEEKENCNVVNDAAAFRKRAITGN